MTGANVIKSKFISKYKHALSLKNYSPNTVSAYLRGFDICPNQKGFNK